MRYQDAKLTNTKNNNGEPKLNPFTGNNRNIVNLCKGEVDAKKCK